MGISFTKGLIFSLIILCGNICYGQVPISKDKALILITNQKTCGLSRQAEKHFTDPDVRSFMGEKGIQFVHMYGQDLDVKLHKEWGVTYYPAVVYLMKSGGEYVLSKTVSGPKQSSYLGQSNQVRFLLGMKAETYKDSPSNNPLIPGSQPPMQYVSPSPQYNTPPQQFIQGNSGSS